MRDFLGIRVGDKHVGFDYYFDCVGELLKSPSNAV